MPSSTEKKPTVRCPECRTPMPYTVAACPNCGRRMVNGPSNTSHNESNPNAAVTTRASGMSREKKGCLIILGIIAVLVLALVIVSSRPPKCPIDGTSMTATGRSFPRDDGKAGRIREYRCPNGHEFRFVDNNPSP
jgi:DNA-directed RNA polymerase subunit RPC12/RpoP